MAYAQSIKWDVFTIMGIAMLFSALLGVLLAAYLMGAL